MELGLVGWRRGGKKKRAGSQRWSGTREAAGVSLRPGAVTSAMRAVRRPTFLSVVEPWFTGLHARKKNCQGETGPHIS